MSIGPVEYIAIAFPGNKFSGEIVPAIKELQDTGTIRVLDLVIISKDAEGNVAAIEMSEASPEQQATLGGPRRREHRTCSARRTSRTSARRSTRTAPPALMIWENIWAARFAKSLRDADGILIANGRIPAALVEELMAETRAPDRTQPQTSHERKERPT